MSQQCAVWMLLKLGACTSLRTQRPVTSAANSEWSRSARSLLAMPKKKAEADVPDEPIRPAAKRSRRTSSQAPASVLQDTDDSKPRAQRRQAAEKTGAEAHASTNDAPKKRAAKGKGNADAQVGEEVGGMPITGLWLMKNEPEELSMEILKERPDQAACWDGVRNYQARNFMRKMKIGDKILFYYSSCKVPGIAGIAEVARLAYPDHTAWDPKSPYYDAKSDASNPRWEMVDVRYVRHLPRYLPLDELRRHSGAGGVLEGLPLFTRFRLSVMPVEARYWEAVLKMAGEGPGEGAAEAAGGAGQS